MEFHQTTLKNGLTVLGERRESAVSAALGFFVKTGARDETAEVAGVSHFLEHMMFKGTEKRSALEITYELGAMGAQANAYTSEEHTVYYMNILPEYFDKGVELLSDMLRPSLVDEEFNVEKKVILEEIALYQDRPTHILFETALREFFGTHPAGNSVLGSHESISALRSSQMRDYFTKRYTAQNIVFCAAGNFSWEHLVELIEQYCSEWPSTEAPRETEACAGVAKKSRVTKPGLALGHSCLLSPGPSAQDELRYPAEVLCNILGDSTGSHTYWQLVDKGLADTAYISFDDMDETGVIFGYVSSSAEKIDEAVSVLENIMRKPLDFDDEQLERAKTKLATRFVLQGESSMRRLMAVGNNWLYRKEYLTLDQELLKLSSIGRESIEELLSAFPFAPVTRVDLRAE